MTPRCLDCEHFYVSWDSRFPRGCRQYGIVSRELPSHVVLSATGQRCAAYRLSGRVEAARARRDR